MHVGMMYYVNTRDQRLSFSVLKKNTWRGGGPQFN